MRRWLLLVVRLMVGGTFVVAGALKVASPAELAADIMNYRLLPHAMVNLVAITLPWVEILAGGFLVLGIWPRASGLLITLLTAVFIIAISAALVRGLDVRCGCFGTAEGRKANATTLLQDTVILLAAGWVWRRSPD